MDFKFPYNIAGTATHVVVTIEDDIIAEAKKIGVDIANIEAEARDAIDNFVGKVTSRGFLSTVIHAVEVGVEKIVEDIEKLGEAAGTRP
jgi:pentose-5-phosphate-3-epimerase